MDEVAPFLTAQATHLRVGWALTEGYSPYPGGGEGWGGNGVGDDLYSYGFDGLHLWTGTWTLPGAFILDYCPQSFQDSHHVSWGCWDLDPQNRPTFDTLLLISQDSNPKASRILALTHFLIGS